MSISISVAVSRDSGVVPIAVFFNASSTTSTQTSRPYHHLIYIWDFGDPNSGAAWARGTRTGAGSKNRAYGPLAAHLYRNPGTYVVTLTVFDGVDIKQWTTTITVNAWVDATHGATACFSNDSDHTDAPAGATLFNTVSDFDNAINATADGGVVYKRILFRRDDTFTSSTASSIDAAGVRIGAYGPGAKPLINGASDKIQWRASDCVVEGLNLDCVSDTGEVFAPWVSGIQHLVALDCDMTHCNIALHMSDLRLSSFPFWEYLFILECNITDIGAYAVLGDCHGLVMMGNLMNDNASQHLVRTNYSQRCIHSNNEYGATGIGQRLTVRAFGAFTDGNGLYAPGTAYTEKIYIAENRILKTEFGVRGINNFDDARIRDVIVEYNYLVEGGGATSSGTFTTEGGDLTFRNNISNLTGANNRRVMLISKSSDVNVPSSINDNIEVYNNTAYTADADSAFNFFFVEMSNVGGHFPANFKLQNNIAYAPNYTGNREMLEGSGANDTVSNNTADGAGFAVNPLFVVSPPVVPLDYRLQAGSPYIGYGTLVSVFDDATHVSRRGVTNDAGAHQFNAGLEITADTASPTSVIAHKGQKIWIRGR